MEGTLVLQMQTLQSTFLSRLARVRRPLQTRTGMKCGYPVQSGTLPQMRSRRFILACQMLSQSRTPVTTHEPLRCPSQLSSKLSLFELSNIIIEVLPTSAANLFCHALLHYSLDLPSTWNTIA